MPARRTTIARVDVAHADEIDLPPWWKLIPDLFGRGKRPGILQVLLRAGMVNSGAATLAARQSSTRPAGTR